MSGNHDVTGILFYNGKKKTEKHPDFTGNLEVDEKFVRDLERALVNGKVKINLAGWRKTSAKGNDFVSLRPQVDNGEYSTGRPSSGDTRRSGYGSAPFPKAKVDDGGASDKANAGDAGGDLDDFIPF